MHDYSKFFPAIQKALKADNPEKLRTALTDRSDELLKIAHECRNAFLTVLPCTADVNDFESCRKAVVELDTAKQAAAWQHYTEYCHALEMYIAADCDARMLLAGLSSDFSK